MQLQQVANSTRIFGISSAARARLSAVFLVCVFAGQLIGTAAGTRVYLKYGYRASGGLCLGLTGFMRALACPLPFLRDSLTLSFYLQWLCFSCEGRIALSSSGLAGRADGNSGRPSTSGDRRSGGQAK